MNNILHEDFNYELCSSIWVHRIEYPPTYLAPSPGTEPDKTRSLDFRPSLTHAKLSLSPKFHHSATPCPESAPSLCYTQPYSMIRWLESPGQPGSKVRGD